jgi:hypothetical protein
VTKRSHVKQDCHALVRTTLVVDVPDCIDLERHRDLGGRSFSRPVRWVLIGLTSAVLLLGLLNVFGQHPDTLTAESGKAKLEVYAPSHLRGGLLYEARFTISAHEKLSHAVLLLSPGWAESQQINTIEPSPVAEGSRDGDLYFTLGEVPKGQVHTLFLEFQVNPTNVGRRRADVALYDGDTRLLAIHRTITVYP